MTPDEAVVATYPAVHDVPAVFMLHGGTYAKGAELGFEGIDFYVGGRGAPLGDVDADVVSAAFVFFSPEHVRAAWERSGAVMPRADAALAFMECGYDWARRKLGDEEAVDLPRLAELLGRVVDAASPGCAPLFAAHRAMPSPATDDPAALVLHRLDSLRELRGAVHGACVLAQGLTPHQAVSFDSPGMVPIFGWSAPAPVGDDPGVAERWAAAEAATNRAVAPAFAALSGDELDELALLCNALS